MGKLIDIAGKKFGKLTVLGYSYTHANGYSMWECLCDCGNKKIIQSQHLRSGATNSCGCLHTESVTKHGNASHDKISAEYTSYKAMKARCYNKKHKSYHNYGGRGIKVCDRWLGENGFQNFLEDMGVKPTKKHSIDRFPDKNGDYTPTNCRWATTYQQTRNTRANIWLDFDNGKILMKDFLRITNLGRKQFKIFNQTKSPDEIFSHLQNRKRPSERVKDLFGQTFGRLLVTGFSHINPKNKNAIWECLCVCGNIKLIAGARLMFNDTRSCGCLKKESFNKYNNSRKK